MYVHVYACVWAQGPQTILKLYFSLKAERLISNDNADHCDGSRTERHDEFLCKRGGEGTIRLQIELERSRINRPAVQQTENGGRQDRSVNCALFQLRRPKKD